jgi:hypothetical protein
MDEQPSFLDCETGQVETVSSELLETVRDLASCRRAGALYRLACQGGARAYVCTGKIWTERRWLALRSTWDVSETTSPARSAQLQDCRPSGTCHEMPAGKLQPADFQCKADMGSVSILELGNDHGQYRL